MKKEISKTVTGMTELQAVSFLERITGNKRKDLFINQFGKIEFDVNNDNEITCVSIWCNEGKCEKPKFMFKN